MPTTSLLMLLTAWTLLGPVSIAGSQPSILPQRDGTTSTLTPLGERDAIYSDAIETLFSGRPDALDVIKWKEIFDNLEHAVDECEDVANVLESISLKNS